MALRLWAASLLFLFLAAPVLAGSAGIVGDNNAISPDTQYDLSADLIHLRAPLNPHKVSLVPHEPASILTNNLSTSGPAANGRDQASAFSASSWVHLYWIWNGSTLATLSSASGPTSGPTLPSGYSHWAYAGTVRMNSSGNLARMRIRGAWVYYDGMSEWHLPHGDIVVSGTAQAVSVSSAVPSVALAYQLGIGLRVFASGGNTLPRLSMGATSTGLLVRGTAAPPVGGSGPLGAAPILPNVGQQFYYAWSEVSGISVGAGHIEVTGYTVPNGGE